MVFPIKIKKIRSRKVDLRSGRTGYRMMPEKFIRGI